ncbi:MAG: hypothetical protein GY862_12250 [Gammaproteobacteria bacterium]|nr:hypothetical protein [Gammaproteobacteria bacterium]
MEYRKGDVVAVKAHVHSGYAFPYADKLEMSPEELTEACSTATALHVPEGGENDPTSRCLWRTELKEPEKCMIVGYTTRQTGTRYEKEEYAGYEEGSWVVQDPYFEADKYHKVWMCQPLTSNQWRKPWACLEDDILGICEEVKND